MNNRRTLLAAAAAALSLPLARAFGQATQPAVPTIAGFRPFVGPFASPWGRAGYVGYLAERQDAAEPTAPDGYEPWMSGVNVEGFRFFVIRASRAVPATVPVVVEPPPPPPPPPVYDVQPGGDWVAAVLAAAPGATVRLAPGTYGPWSDPSKRPAKGVTVEGAGIGKTFVRPAGKEIVLAWCWEQVTLRGITFAGPDVPVDHGVRLLGCFEVTLDACQVTNCHMGVAMEPARTRRNRNVRVLNCDLSDNWHPQRKHSHGLYASKVDGLEIRGSTIARNGHNPSRRLDATEQNHGAYVTGDSGPIVAVGNTFEDNSSHGLQARSGGLVKGNTFRRHPIHLSYGLVNGDGPIHLGGVSGRIARNRFDRSVPLAGAPRGYAVEVANVAPAGVEVADNWAYDDAPVPSPRLVKVAWLKVDRCALKPTNPHYGKEVGVRRLAVAANAVTWPTNAMGKNAAGDGNVWIHDSILEQAKRPRDGAVLTIQPAFPPAR